MLRNIVGIWLDGVLSGTLAGSSIASPHLDKGDPCCTSTRTPVPPAPGSPAQVNPAARWPGAAASAPRPCASGASEAPPTASTAPPAPAPAASQRRRAARTHPVRHRREATRWRHARQSRVHDRCSRSVRLAVKDDETERSAIAVLREAAAAFPFQLTHVLTDNGSCFTPAFAKICATLGAQCRHARPRTPQTKGMVERLDGRVGREALGIDITSHRALEQLLRGFNQACHAIACAPPEMPCLGSSG